MRLAVFLIFLVAISSFLIASAQTPDQPAAGQTTTATATGTATIQGVVVTADGKKPIPRALVSLSKSHRSVTTNEKGEFVFTQVPFGTEVVDAKRDGFLCAGWRAPFPECVKTIEVNAPDTRVELTLMPEAVVTGRVVDQEGRPIPNLTLSLLQRQVTQNAHYGWVGIADAKTDASGVFRIAKLQPETYLLYVLAAFDPPGDHVPFHPERGFSATWYPGVLNQKVAQPLVLHAGDEIKANLIVRRESVQPVTLNYPWDPPVKPFVIGLSTSDIPGSGLFARGQFEDDRSFHFFAPPGEYKAGVALFPPTDPKTAEPLPWPDGTTKPYYGSAKFTVRDRPVNIGDVPVQQPVNLALHVHAQLTGPEKQQDSSPLAPPVVHAGGTFELLGNNIQFNNRFEWRVDRPASTFEFKDIPPGQYILRAYGNGSAYVASLACGSLDLLREPLVTGPGIPACSIEAVMRDDFASLSVGLTPEAGVQMTASGIRLNNFVLIPVGKPFDLVLSGFGPTNPKQLHKVRIPPGSYIAFLFDGQSRAWREPELQEQLKRLGTPVTLAPGDDKTIILDSVVSG